MDALLLSILVTGFGVALLHAALPTHWLPFVLVGRAQGWRAPQVLGVAALAGLAHVAFTAILGLGLSLAGSELNARVGGVLPVLVSIVLIGLGAYYIVRAARGRIHLHAGVERKAFSSGRAAVAGLVLALAFSPCEAFLPVYASGATYGLAGFVALSIVLVVATLGAMVAFTGLALLGVERLRLGVLARHEGTILGAVLIILGVVVLGWHP